MLRAKSEEEMRELGLNYWGKPVVEMDRHELWAVVANMARREKDSAETFTKLANLRELRTARERDPTRYYYADGSSVPGEVREDGLTHPRRCPPSPPPPVPYRRPEGELGHPHFVDPTPRWVKVLVGALLLLIVATLYHLIDHNPFL